MATAAAAPARPNARRSTKSRKLTVGATSGMLTALVFQPFDVLRTQQQGAFGSTLPSSHRTGMRAFAASLRSVDLRHRVVAMWRGSGVTLVRVAGGAGLYFLTLDQCLEAIPQTNVNTFLAGAFARAFAGVVTSPLTVLKARMEYQPAGSRATSWRVMQQVLQTEGARGLFRGIVPTLLRDVPFSGIYVALYKRIQLGIASADWSRQYAVPLYATNFGCGVVSGVLATTIVHPADVIKTRMQLALVVPSRGIETATTTKVKNSLTFVQTIGKMWTDEGATAFAKGIVPRVLKRTLATAVTWTLYEQFSTSSSK